MVEASVQVTHGTGSARCFVESEVREGGISLSFRFCSLDGKKGSLSGRMVEKSLLLAEESAHNATKATLATTQTNLTNKTNQYNSEVSAHNATKATLATTSSKLYDRELECSAKKKCIQHVGQGKLIGLVGNTYWTDNGRNFNNDYSDRSAKHYDSDGLAFHNKFISHRISIGNAHYIAPWCGDIFIRPYSIVDSSRATNTERQLNKTSYMVFRAEDLSISNPHGVIIALSNRRSSIWIRAEGVLVCTFGSFDKVSDTGGVRINYVNREVRTGLTWNEDSVHVLAGGWTRLNVYSRFNNDYLYIRNYYGAPYANDRSKDLLIFDIMVCSN